MKRNSLTSPDKGNPSGRHALRQHISMYLSIFRLRGNMELQYRGAMVGGIVCQTFFGLILIALYRALYDTRPQTLPLQNVVTYVWLQQAFFRMLLATDGDLSDKILTGGIAYDLCRPADLYSLYFVRIMAQKLTGSLMRGIPMMLIAFLLPKGWGAAPPASLPHLFCALFALFLGLVCVCALENITMGFTMLTLDPRGLQGMMHLLMMIFAGNILPLTLFPDSWQKIITCLPFAQMLDAPIRFYTGDYALADAGRILPLQALWAVLLIFSGRFLWKHNQKRLVLQGG